MHLPAVLVIAILLIGPPCLADGDAAARTAQSAQATVVAELAKDVKPPDGFTATIFATPHQANYPVFVAVTPDGTLFVSSDGNASLGRDPDRGRVLRLRDIDGDGMADEVKTFIPGLDSPRGLLWVDDRLLVLHPPHVSSFRDADGDGVAEERKKIISNIAFELAKRPADHTSNGLALGVDGWVYAAIGFITRLSPTGVDAPPVPDVARLSAGELVAILAGPSHRLRLAAQRALVSRGLVSEAAADLEKLAAYAKARLASRVAAIFTLALGHGERAAPGLVSLSRDPAVAAWAVRALGDLAAAGIAVPAGTVRAALASPDPRTRKEAVVASVRIATAESAAAILPLTADADLLVAHTAIEGLVRLAATREADVIAACATRLDDSATPPALHRGAARVLGEIHTDAAADAVIERLAKAADAARRADLAWAAARLFMREAAWKEQSWGTIPDTSGPYYGPERWSASDRVQAALLAALKAAPAAELPALARTVALHRLPAEAVMPVLRGRDDAARGLVAFLDVSGGEPADAQIAAIAAAATDPANNPPGRLAAIRVLSRHASPATLLPLCDALIVLEASGAGERNPDDVLSLVSDRRGDKALGMELFVAKKCVACHASGVDSAGLGPSLANAASIYSRRELAQAVLQPNKTIAQGFATTAILLDDGRPLLGFVTNEGADTVTLRDGQGAEHTVRKDAIEERIKLQTSMMPEGLVSDLSVGQFASLIDFIESIGK